MDQSSAKSDNDPVPKTHRTGRGRWVIYLMAAIFVLIGLFMGLIMLATGASLGGFGTVQMAVAQYTPKDVVGDLGGMPVTIPRHMAEFVEYEGDPGWGQKRKGPVPERTHQSKLTSFGVQFRYPDMATLSGPEMWADQNSKNIYVTDWMSFGVKAGSRYYGVGWLDRVANGAINSMHAKQYIYVKQERDEYGLQKYLMVNKDTGLPDSNMPSVTRDIVYIARDKQGNVIAYIGCSAVKHRAAPCSHYFGMESQGVASEVRVGYRRPMLEQWKDIQFKVAEMVLEFKAN